MSSVLASRLRDAELARLAVSADRAIAESVGSMGPAPVATTGGDPLLLRGIPAIGRSVAGAIRGTDPERSVMR